MPEWNKSWSEWLREGYYLSYRYNGVTYYEHVIGRDFAHWEYDWPETISSGSESGPNFPANLEVTRGYNSTTGTNRIWQMIFGIKSQAFIYIELPTDTHRHGIPKEPKPSSSNRYVSHFTEWMSPFLEPSFITEHFMMRPMTTRIGFDGYNPCAIDLTDVRLNIIIAKLDTERIGTVYNDTPTATKERWTETLNNLHRRRIPFRPITVLPITAPAEAISGE